MSSRTPLFCGTVKSCLVLSPNTISIFTSKEWRALAVYSDGERNKRKAIRVLLQPPSKAKLDGVWQIRIWKSETSV